MQITDSDFTRPKDEYSSYFGRPYDVLVVSDDQTTANMDPCSLRDALASGTIMPFSSKQIELVLTLDLLSGRSGLSFVQNKPGGHLEETDAASKQKSLTDCLFRAVTLFR